MRFSLRGKTLSLVMAFMFSWLAAPRGSADSVIGVLTLHGVGSQREGSGFDAKLRKTLREEADKDTTIVAKSVYYHGESVDLQARLWKEFDRLEDDSPGSLDHKIVRRILLLSLGDALAYANDPKREGSFYRRVHHKVRAAVDQLGAELGDGPPIAVVTHSLGGKVIFDYVCDAQTEQGIWEGRERPSEFQKLANMRLLITTGCNIPYFESAMPRNNRRFFHVNEGFQWINIYDRDDLLGWPLRPLGEGFRQHVQDEERNGIGSSLTSHIKYWRHDKLTDEIAERILELAKPRTSSSINE